jgi:hypothetical protein
MMFLVRCFFMIAIASSMQRACYAQLKYSFRFEIAHLHYIHKIVDIDPGLNWRGYHLDRQQNGLIIDIVNGISIGEKVLTGAGLGYINFEGLHGGQIYFDLQWLMMNSNFSPLIGLKVGFNHIWNQYEGGNSSGLLQIEAGVNVRTYRRCGVYLQSGFSIQQQALLVPVRLGIRF